MSTNKIKVTVNNKVYEKEIDSRTLLVDFIREKLGLTGTHVGCDTTNCGACTVLLDGRPVKSCTVLAMQANGKTITTIEGLSHGKEMHPLQKAFIDKNGLQCGYCTAGMIMMAHWLIRKNPDATRDEIREAISGNICRCTGYDSIVDSIEEASRQTIPEEEDHLATKQWRR
jgi:carbon-monoxide dehydrogenase small subunit